MANIPREIIESCILPRLLVKSLIRFKCVSKSWQTLISSPDFVRIHHRHALSTDANRLIISGYIPRVPNCFHIYNFDSLDDPPSLCPYPLPHPMPESEYAIASCEFFLLLLVERRRKHDKLILLNPSTRTYHDIPPQNFPNNCSLIKYGICIDEADDDCKVIMICQYSDYIYGEIKVMIMIYSFKTNSWRSIEHKLIRVGLYDTHNNDVFVVNNLLYTRLASPYKYKEGLRIGCFDIRAEQWTNDIPLPNDIDPHWCPYLRELDGSICVTGYEKEKHGSYCVWVMKDYCWVKLIRGVEWRSCGHINYYMYYPIAYRTGSRHELLFIGRFNCAVYWYDTQDQVAKYIKFNDYYLDDGCRIIQHVLKGSLVTFSKKLRCPKKDEDVRFMYRHDPHCWTSIEEDSFCS